MITRREYEAARIWAWDKVRESGVVVAEADFAQLAVADLGLSEFEVTGLAILTLVSTPWVGVKLLILKPNQFFAQHRHPPAPAENYPGKEEIFRGQWGEAYLYVPGEPTAAPHVLPPPHRRPYCTVWREVALTPATQFLCPPNTWHWFQAGPRGAVVWSYSSKVTDAQDQFSDPQVVRQTVIVED